METHLRQMGKESKISIKEGKICQVFSVTLFIVTFVCITNAQATVISTSGDINLIAAPASVKLDALTSDDTIFGFDEVQDFTLGSDLPVNAVGAGFFVGTGSPATDSIAAGTVINSTFFHVDSIAVSATRFFGTATFDTNILAIIFERSELNNSDSILGALGTSYSALEPDSDFREFEAGDPCGTSVFDCATVSADLRTITLDMGTTAFIDQIRVITAAVPEPTTITLLVLGFVGLGIARRRLH